LEEVFADFSTVRLGNDLHKLTINKLNKYSHKPIPAIKETAKKMKFGYHGYYGAAATERNSTTTLSRCHLLRYKP